MRACRSACSLSPFFFFFPVLLEPESFNLLFTLKTLSIHVGAGTSALIATFIVSVAPIFVLIFIPIIKYQKDRKGKKREKGEKKKNNKFAKL
jgi:hypothetical protein